MDNELKEYLSGMETRLTERFYKKIDNLDREHIDEDLQEHRHNSEVHVKATANV